MGGVGKGSRVGRTIFTLVTTVLVAAASAQERPLPARQAFLDATRVNLERSQARQRGYAYHERRRELHTNLFGRLGSGEGTEEYAVVPEPDGSVARTLVARDGMPVAGAETERSRPRARTGPRKSAVADAADVLDLAIDHRETRGGRDVIVVTFAPKAAAHSETREGRIAQQFRGKIYIDETEKEIVRIEATAIDDITYGFGVVARIDEGASATLVRERIDAMTWLPTSIQLSGEGRAMVFRKLRIDHRIDWFEYRRVPAIPLD